MSGLFGIVDFAAPRIEPEELRRLAELASYRAPGGITCHFLEGAGLAHLALHEERPLLDSERKICVLFDGRLDNRPELIARLSPARGAEASDTELLLAAYLEWGEVCTDRLLGDFAFAIWDAGRRRLFCAVDPLGIKPLHYAQVGSLICFASDAVQVLQHPAVPDGYNEAEIAAYLAGCCEDPERSFFAAVHKLGPGRRLVAENGSLRAERYWSPAPKEIRYPRDEDYADHFREILQQAVTDRMRGAGSFVGIAMSGGLDSTSVAALAQRASTTGIRAYSFVFNRLTDCDERAYSRSMTEELGLEVEPVEAERLWDLESRSALPHSPDTPFVGWHTCYREILRQMAVGGSRVLLIERFDSAGCACVRPTVTCPRYGRSSATREAARSLSREPYIDTLSVLTYRPASTGPSSRRWESARTACPRGSTRISSAGPVSPATRELHAGASRAQHGAKRMPIWWSTPGTGGSPTGTTGTRPPSASRCATPSWTGGFPSMFSRYPESSFSGLTVPRAS